MVATVPDAAPAPARQDPTGHLARIAGVFFLITFLGSIPAQFLFYEPVLQHSHYILGDGARTSIALGAFCEIAVIIANLGTAIALFPVLKRQSEPLALGYVVARVLESVMIGIGILSLLSLATLQQKATGTGADDATLVLAGKTLVTVHDWTFLLGPGFVVGLGNGLILGYLMYRTELVPRRMAMLGLVGGPLILLSGTAVLFGLWDQVSPASALATVPEFFWELSLAVYLTWKGFRPAAVARLYPTTPMSGAVTA